MAKKYKDIIGWVMKEHGVPQSKLTVLSLERTEERTTKGGYHSYHRFYNCQCECGNKKVIEERFILSGHTSSCGCKRRGDNLEGKRFGRLTVLKYLGLKEVEEAGIRRRSFYLCRCDCGKEIEVQMKALKTGQKRSCGCLAKDTIAEVGRRNHKTNTYDLTGEYGVGYCLNTGTPFFFDLEDYEKICRYAWIEHFGPGGRYSRVVTTIYPEKRVESMAGVVMGEKYLDHINRNPMDNRKNNLRRATRRENNLNITCRKDNKSGVTGVNYCNYCQRWVAHITVPKENQEQGRGRLITRRFKNKEEAIKCRLQMEHDYYGEFAPQRHLFAQYGIKED